MPIFGRTRAYHRHGAGFICSQTHIILRQTYSGDIVMFGRLTFSLHLIVMMQAVLCVRPCRLLQPLYDVLLELFYLLLQLQSSGMHEAANIS